MIYGQQVVDILDLYYDIIDVYTIIYEQQVVDLIYTSLLDSVSASSNVSKQTHA